MITVLHTVQMLAEAEEPSGIAALGISPLAILAQACTFIVLFLLARPALKKIVATLENRRLTINKGVELGIEMQKQQDAFEDRMDALLKEARAEGDRIIKSGHTEAALIIKEAEDAAAAKALRIQKDAEARISEETEKARQSLAREVVSLVAEATEVLIKEKLDKAKDIALIEKALKGDK